MSRPDPSKVTRWVSWHGDLNPAHGYIPGGLPYFGSSLDGDTVFTRRLLFTRFWWTRLLLQIINLTCWGEKYQTILSLENLWGNRTNSTCIIINKYRYVKRCTKNQIAYLHVECFVNSQSSRLTESLPTLQTLKRFLFRVDISKTNK